MGSSYRDILRRHPPRGRAEEGEVELIPEDEVEPTDSRHDLVHANPYFRVVQEPVLFPSGHRGTYFRVFKGRDPDRTVAGAAVMPLRVVAGREPEIGLVHQFRYPAGGWMAEIPRGAIEPGEPVVECAVRELREETGLGEPDTLVHLGNLLIDSGDSPSEIAHFVAVYLGVPNMGEKHLDDGEAIADTIWRPFSSWFESAMHPPFSGRPIGGLDAFTVSSFGLVIATGVVARLERAWTTVLQQTWHSLRAVDSRLAAELMSSPRALRVAVRATSAVRTEIERHLPRIAIGESEGSTLILENVRPLAVALIAELPGTMSVRLA